MNLASNKSGNNLRTNPVEFSNLPALIGSFSLVSSRLSKENMKKSKFHGKNKGKTILQYFYV